MRADLEQPLKLAVSKQPHNGDDGSGPSLPPDGLLILWMCTYVVSTQPLTLPQKLGWRTTLSLGISNSWTVISVTYCPLEGFCRVSSRMCYLGRRQSFTILRPHHTVHQTDFDVFWRWP